MSEGTIDRPPLCVHLGRRECFDKMIKSVIISKRCKVFFTETLQPYLNHFSKVSRKIVELVQNQQNTFVVQLIMLFTIGFYPINTTETLSKPIQIYINTRSLKCLFVYNTIVT